MEMYWIAGKKAAVLLNPFMLPTNAFVCGIDYDRGKNVGKI